MNLFLFGGELMSAIQIKRIRTIHHVLVSAAIVVAGICLMVACVGIYQTGDHPFSREVVAAAFARIAVPVYLCLGLVIAGFVLYWLLPAEERRLKPDLTAPILRRLQAQADLSQAEPAAVAAVQREQKSRKLHQVISVVLAAVGSAVFLWYALQGNSFHQSEINSSMIRAMLVLLPCMGVPFAYGVFAAYHGQLSMKREIDLLKPIPKTEVAAPKGRFDGVFIARCAVLVLGLVLLVWGALENGAADVLTKAINICTECIGLG